MAQSDLHHEACESCSGNLQPLTQEEATGLLAQLSEWQLVSVGGVLQLQKSYRFSDFLQAVAFTNRIAEMAESLQHHPDIQLGWGYVSLTWYTHKIQGLHRNDFRCAARSDQCDNAIPSGS